MFVSVAITFYSFALCAAKVPLGQCSRVLLLWRNSISKLKAKVWRKNQLCHEARWFFTEKSSESFTAICSFPQRLQRRRLSSRSYSRSNWTQNERVHCHLIQLIYVLIYVFTVQTRGNMKSICCTWLKKEQIIGKGDDLYTSILQKIIGKNLSKRVYNLLYKLWKMITCVCTDDKLLLIVHLFANTPEKVIK